MAGDVIGSAVVEVTADASGLSAGIAQATQAVKGFEAAAAGSGARAGAAMSKANKDASITSAQLTREQERLIASINNYSTTIGKSRGEVLEYRAAQAGIADQVQAQITAIRAQEAALASSGKALNRYGVSAGQTAQALRQVPAQLSDIIVSLQAGQAPLTVLLQQGAQLKDSFGGVVPAAKALGGAVLGLINPYTLAAAAAAALAFAYSKGSAEADGYTRALVLTGNISGTTASQIATMAQNIDATIGTQYEAAEALTALAGSGQVAGMNLEKFGETAVRVNKYIGTSVEDTVKAFSELGKDPVKASERLNETMNYLTLAVYDQIKAAQENGREQEAANIAQNAYADALNVRTKQMEGSLGVFQRAWRALAGDAKEAWDEILGIGRPQTLGDGLAGAQKRLSYVQSNGGNAAPIQQEINDRSRAMLREIDNAAAEAERAQTAKAQIAARKRLDDQKKATRTRAEQRADELKDFQRDAKLVSLAADDYAKGIANINEKYKDKKVAAPKAFQDDAATKYLMQLRETQASLQAQLADTDKLTASEKELAKFAQQIADIKEKRTLTAEQKSLLASQDAITAQLEKNVAVEAEVKAQEKKTAELKKQEEAQKRFTERAAQIQDQIATSQENRREGYGRTLGAFGRSDQERARLEDQQQLYRENERMQAQLTKATPKELLGSDQYITEMMKIKGALDQSLADHDAYYADLKAAQGNWVNGATRALGETLLRLLLLLELGRLLFLRLDLSFDGDVLLKLRGDRVLAGQQALLLGIVQQQITKPIAQWLQGALQDPESLVGNVFGGLMSDKGSESWLGSLLGVSSKGAAGTGVERGASVANPLYVRSADPVSGITSGSTGSSGGSSWLDTAFSLASSAVGGFGNSTATSMANSAGTGLDGLFRYTNNFSGRAGGGWVGPRSTYEVAENAPELLTVGNKTMLMTGNQSGQVTPLKEERRGASPFIVNFAVQGKISNDTQTQVAQKLRRETNTATARF